MPSDLLIIVEYMCDFCIWLFWRVPMYLLGFNISVPYSPSKDGISTFTALAGFAVAQGVALTAVAKGENREWLIISIYGAMVLLTAGWTSFMLRRIREEYVGSPPVLVIRRAFDRPSTNFGRWTFGWISMVGVVMVILGCLQLLPNQTRRVAFPDKSIECIPFLIHNREQSNLATSGGSNEDRELADSWIKDWLTKIETKPVENKDKKNVYTQRMIWIEQAVPFKDYYKSFDMRITYDNKTYKLNQSLAFLAKRIDGSARMSYRQLMIREKNGSTIISFDSPSEGDRLVIITLANSTDASFEVPSDPRKLGITILE